MRLGLISSPLTSNVSLSKIQPGHALRIQAQTSLPDADLHVEGLGQSFDLTRDPKTTGYAEGWLAIPLATIPVSVTLTATAVRHGQVCATQIIPVEVVARDPFKISKLTLKNFQLDRYDQESKIFAEARKNSSGFSGMPITLWNWPVHGRITETFGNKRVYNQGLGGWYHGGLDIAAPGGTTITAPAAGVVILAGFFAAHGGTVLLDHGYGIITAYLHQRTIYVTPGERLQAGQAIGAVGSTGGSTGNHLHFQVNIHGEVASPWDFLNDTGPAANTTTAIAPLPGPRASR